MKMNLNSTRRTSVTFDGYYGMRNAGDDAFCVVAARHARDTWGCQEVSFIARPSHLPALPAKVRALLPDEPRIRGHTRMAPLGPMVRHRTVVHVGGSTFMAPLTRHRDQARLSRLGCLDLHAVGVSVGPFPSDCDAAGIRQILTQFRSVSVRDSLSLQRVRDLLPEKQVRLGFDVAVLLDPTRPPRRQEDAATRAEPLIGVTVCAHEGERGGDVQTERRRFEQTLRTVEEVARATGSRVRIFVFNDHPRWGDHLLSAEMAARLSMPTEVVVRERDTGRLLAAVAQCDAMVATRLHSSVFAYATGVPFIAVAYQEKGVEVTDEMGVPRDLVFGADGPDPGNAVPRLLELLDQGPAKTLLPLEEARRRARGGFPAIVCGHPNP